MPVQLHSDVDPVPVEFEPIAAVLYRLLADHDQSDRDLVVVLIDDGEMRRMHRQFLGIDAPTDCLSFPFDPPELGEVYVSADTARRQAAARGLSLEAELLLYAVHGTLHLLGYNDHEPDQAERMRQAEARYAGIRGDDDE